MKNIPVSYLVLDISTFLIICLMYIPQLSLFPMRSQLIVALMFLCLLVTFLHAPSFFGSSKYNRLFVISILYMAMIPLFGGLDVITNRYLMLFVCPFFYVLYSFNRKYRTAGANMKFIYLWIPILLYVCINTFIGLMKHPYLVRLIKSSGAETEVLRSMGYGGYELIYSVLLLTVIILAVLMERKKIHLKAGARLTLFASLCFLLLLIVYSNYFTAFSLALGSIVIYIVFYNRKLLYVLIPLLIVYAFFSTNINIFLIEELTKITPQDGKTYFRLTEILNHLKFGIQAEGLDTRADTTSLSVGTFLEHPVGGYLFGTYYSPEDFLSKIGQHSFILDTLAIYGLFVGIVMMGLMLIPFIQRMKSGVSSKQKLFAFVTGICFLLIIGMNNLTPTIGFVAFFVFPTIYEKSLIYNRT